MSVHVFVFMCVYMCATIIKEKGPMNWIENKVGFEGGKYIGKLCSNLNSKKYY